MTVRLRGPLLDPAWEVSPLGLEEVVLAYLSRHAMPSTTELQLVAPGPERSGHGAARGAAR